MDINISEEINKLVLLGFGNVEIKRKLFDKGISISNATIYRHFLKEKNKFYEHCFNFDFNRLPKNILKVFARVNRQKERGIFIEFALNPLHGWILKKEIRVIPRFSKDFKKMIIFPEKDSKIKLSASKNSRKITLSFSSFVKDPKKFSERIELYIPLAEFGIEDFETISDIFGSLLYNELKKLGWTLTELRCTDRNIYADLLVISPRKKLYLIELTEDCKNMRVSKQIRKILRLRLSGKTLMLKAMSEKMNASPVIVLWKGLLDNGILDSLFKDACKLINTPVIFTDFDESWAKNVAEKINNLDQNVKI